MSMQEIVAANVRARLAWGQISHDAAAQAAGCSIRSFRYKISGEYGFRPDELAGLASLLGLADIGTLFRVPEGFVTSESVSAWTNRPRHLSVVAA
jgi:hypothetical protein